MTDGLLLLIIFVTSFAAVALTARMHRDFTYASQISALLPRPD